MDAVELDRPPPAPDDAGGRAVHARQRLDQRRLAGAVLAEEDMDLAGPQIEIDGIECHHAGEMLAQPLDREQRRRPGRLPRGRAVLMHHCRHRAALPVQLTLKTGFQSSGASEEA